MKKKYVMIGILTGIFIIVLSIVVISMNSKTIDYRERKVDDWYNDIIAGKEVITIYGASYCSHCQDYYPVISKIANKYKLNLYFFEVDTLRENNSDDYDKLMNSFETEGYDGSVPYTFIMKNGIFKTYTSGFANRDVTMDFLKQSGVIKD